MSSLFPSPAQDSESITVTELAANTERVQLIDVREPNEFALAHIEGATLIPLASLQRSVDLIGADVPVVVHCHHDSRSRIAAMMLQQIGIRDVRWLEGGIDAWSRQIDPTVPIY